MTTVEAINDGLALGRELLHEMRTLNARLAAMAAVPVARPAYGDEEEEDGL